MSMVNYTPAIRITPTLALATPATPTGIVGAAASLTYATGCYYRVLAAYDGGGRLRSAISGARIMSGAQTNVSVNVAWSTVTNARCYLLFRSVNNESNYVLIYSGPNLSVTDYGGGVGAYANLTPSLTSTTTGPTTYSLAKVAIGSYLPFNAAHIHDVRYEDLSDTTIVSANRKLVVKEYGVRPVVPIGFQVIAGSTEEEVLQAIYGAKLAFPDANGAGCKIALSLNFQNATSTFRDVRIVGNFSRTPTEGKNTRTSFEWEFHCVDPIYTIPPIVNLDGTGLW